MPVQETQSDSVSHDYEFILSLPTPSPFPFSLTLNEAEYFTLPQCVVRILLSELEQTVQVLNYTVG